MKNVHYATSLQDATTKHLTLPPTPRKRRERGKKKQPSITSSCVCTNGKRSPQLKKYTDDKIEQTEKGEKGLICV